MKFETVERFGRVHVVKNGVESAEFVILSFDGHAVYQPEYLLECKTRETALEIIAHGMDNWYTVLQAAERLAELGKVATAPERHTMYRWLSAGRFLGAIRIPGMRGRGHPWRIPEEALRKFNRGGEKR